MNSNVDLDQAMFVRNYEICVMNYGNFDSMNVEPKMFLLTCSTTKNIHEQQLLNTYP